MLYPVELGVRGDRPKLYRWANLQTTRGHQRFAGPTIMPEIGGGGKACQESVVS